MFSNDILNLILLRSFYLCTLYNSSVYRAQDPTSPFVHGAWLYSYIPHGVFVALDILGGAFVGLRFKIRLFFECFKLAGFTGSRACAAFLSGRLKLDDFPEKYLKFSEGASYE